jgi:diguanylate cyclase (GGDEF)-like protein
VCAAVLATHGPTLRLREVILLAVVASLFRQKGIISRRAPDGTALLSYHPGDSLFLIAMLRGGPEQALATSLLSIAITLAWTWRTWFPGKTLRSAYSLFYFPALTWFGGQVYHWLGGQPIVTSAHSAAFFQDPFAVILPLLGMMLVCTEGINRLCQAVIMWSLARVPIRQTLLDPVFSFFDYVEYLGGLLVIVLWTAWGWATLPLTLVNACALVMAARSYFDHREAQRAAERDALTGAASWRTVDQALQRRMRSPRSGPFALLFLDVDGLKVVNDRFGHKYGDDLLRLIAEVCRRHARGHDIVARRGGDEFLVILNNLTREQAETVVARLRSEINRRVEEHPEFSQVQVGESIGVAAFPADGREPQALIEEADRRMYEDKRGRKSGDPLALLSV